MRVPIYYGGELLKIEISNDNLMGVLKPRSIEVGDEKYLIKHAIENPVNFMDFKDFISDVKALTLIVNDHERPTPTAKILTPIWGYLKDKKFEILVASGSHRPPTEEELKGILGAFYNKIRRPVMIHDCEKQENLTYIGTTKLNTDVYVNNLVLDSDGVLVIGSVEPHYFAGFTGGRKFLIPGVAGYSTIEQNHKYALDKRAQPLVLDGNPVHEDMMDGLNLLNKYDELFSIMAVLNVDRKICSVHSGHINDTFQLSVNFSMRVNSVSIEEKADIVVAVANSPFDINLYQAHKAIEHAKMALKPGGILIIVAKCGEGIGPRNFYDLLSSSSSPAEVYEKISRQYKLGYHKAAKIADILTWADVWAYTSINANALRKIFIKPYHNLQQAIDDALKLKGKEAKVLVVNDAALLVPRVEK